MTSTEALVKPLAHCKEGYQTLTRRPAGCGLVNNQSHAESATVKHVGLVLPKKQSADKQALLQRKLLQTMLVGGPPKRVLGAKLASDARTLSLSNFDAKRLTQAYFGELSGEVNIGKIHPGKGNAMFIREHNLHSEGYRTGGFEK